MDKIFYKESWINFINEIAKQTGPVYTFQNEPFFPIRTSVSIMCNSHHADGCRTWTFTHLRVEFCLPLLWSLILHPPHGNKVNTASVPCALRVFPMIKVFHGRLEPVYMSLHMTRVGVNPGWVT